MSGYTLLRLVHSYWRWAVLVSAMVVVVRALAGARGKREWSPQDERASRLFVAAVDVQMLLGVTLYFAFSPFWSAAYHSFHALLADKGSRFFGVEHQSAMLLAVIAAHAGRARARAVSGAAKHRAMLVAMAVFFALTLWAIPWPWRSFGRPLFRVSF